MVMKNTRCTPQIYIQVFKKMYILTLKVMQIMCVSSGSSPLIVAAPSIVYLVAYNPHQSRTASLAKFRVWYSTRCRWRFDFSGLMLWYPRIPQSSSGRANLPLKKNHSLLLVWRHHGETRMAAPSAAASGRSTQPSDTTCIANRSRARPILPCFGQVIR